MDKPTCEQCRYYLSIDETNGFCGNFRINKRTRSAAKACGQYEQNETIKKVSRGEKNV